MCDICFQKLGLVMNQVLKEKAGTSLINDFFVCMQIYFFFLNLEIKSLNLIFLMFLGRKSKHKSA